MDRNGNWGFEFLGGNSSFLSELGIDVELIKQNAELALNFIPPEDIKKLNSKLHSSARNLSLFEWEGEFKLFSIKSCWLKFSASPVKADDQSIIWTGLAIDITEQKNLQNKIQILNKQLKEQAESDYLTGLINRRRFYADIKKQLNRFERYDEIFCLAIIDLDNFKSINDRYGHKIGDELLKHFSQILKSKIRNTDVCSRIGGEEFALFFPHTTLEDGILICERIINEIKFIENSKNNNSKIVYTCSIGLTEVTDGDIFSNVFIRADQKLYNAKNNGKNQLKY